MNNKDTIHMSIKEFKKNGYKVFASDNGNVKNSYKNLLSKIVWFN